MKLRRRFVRVLAAAAILAGLATPWGAGAMELIEPPILAEAVARNELPPIAERLPDSPSRAAMSVEGQVAGEHGGTLTMLMGRAKEIRMMMVYGYARLVGYDPELNLVADIIESFEVEDQ